MVLDPYLRDYKESEVLYDHIMILNQFSVNYYIFRFTAEENDSDTSECLEHREVEETNNHPLVEILLHISGYFYKPLLFFL